MYILEILEFLFMYSDKNNHVTVKDIAEYLKSLGLSPQKKTIRANLIRLIEFYGNRDNFYIDMEEMPDGHFEYWVEERVIDLYDGINIANAVCMNDSLEIKYKRDVTDKICQLIGKVNEKQFYKIINMNYFNAVDLRYISYISEVFADAINESKKVKFQYNVDLKNKSSDRIRVVSPYKIIQKNRFSYLLADCDSHDVPISFFRLDRVSEPIIMEESINKIDINIDEYVNFPIISLGKTINIKMIVDRCVIGHIYDRYGYEVRQYKEADGRVRIIVDDKMCDNLLGWLFMLGEYVEIESPQELKTEYKNKLEKIIKHIK